MTAASVVVHPEGSAVRIVMGGEIDLENALEIEEQLSAAITNETSAVTLDLTDLAYLDSAGLRVLFALGARLEVLRIEMTVLAPPGSLTRRVLQLSGFEGVAALDG